MPLVLMIELGAIVAVVGVIEAVAIFLDGSCSQDGVIENLLHAIAVAAVACGSHEVASYLKVRVGAAGGFKAGVIADEAFADFPASGSTKSLAGAPATGRETLRANKI